MYPLVLFFSLLLCISVNAQFTYNPQNLYDNPGGLFDEDSLRTIYLDFYNPNYHSFLVNAWFYNPDERIPAKLTLNGIEYDSVAVRYKGNSTFCLPNDVMNQKVPYNIDMNKIVSGQNILGYKKLKLANAWMDPTFAKQITASNIYRRYLPTGESNLVRLNVQGNYLGLYVNDESINKQFLNKHFGEDDGALFKCDNIVRFCDTANAPDALPPNLYFLGEDSSLYFNSYDMKSDNGWNSLIDLIKTIELEFQNIDSILNVDRVLWAFAVNQVIANFDCYNTYYIHNYYLYQTGDGLFQMIPWDLDNSYIGAIMGWDFWNPSVVYEFDPFFSGGPYTGPGGTPQPWEARPLLTKLLDNDLYRKIYEAHLRTIINESLDANLIGNNVNNLQNLAYSSANQDVNKVFSMNEFSDNVNNPIWAIFNWGFAGILSTVNERKLFLINNSFYSLNSPSINNVTIINNILTAEVFNADSVEMMFTLNQYNSKFKSLQMHDDGTNGDLFANDGIYSLEIPTFLSSNDLKFYIRAENNDAITLSPERAEYEFYTYLAINNVNESQTLTTKKLLKIVDQLGRTTKNKKGIPLFFIYDDGSVEKKIKF